MRTISFDELTRAIERKVLSGAISGSKELTSNVEVDGVVATRVTIPKKKRGSVKLKTLTSIRQQLYLSVGEFEDLCSCPFSGADLQARLREVLEAADDIPLPSSVRGTITEGGDEIEYEAYEHGRLRFGWIAPSSFSDAHRAVIVRMEQNPARQWNVTSTHPSSSEAQEAAADLYRDSTG